MGFSTSGKGVLLAYIVFSMVAKFKIGIVHTKSRFLGPLGKTR